MSIKAKKDQIFLPTSSLKMVTRKLMLQQNIAAKATAIILKPIAITIVIALLTPLPCHGLVNQHQHKKITSTANTMIRI
jgi:hypothetical protein